MLLDFFMYFSYIKYKYNHLHKYPWNLYFWRKYSQIQPAVRGKNEAFLLKTQVKHMMLLVPKKSKDQTLPLGRIGNPLYGSSQRLFFDILCMVSDFQGVYMNWIVWWDHIPSKIMPEVRSFWSTVTAISNMIDHLWASFKTAVVIFFNGHDSWHKSNYSI